MIGQNRSDFQIVAYRATNRAKGSGVVAVKSINVDAARIRSRESASLGAHDTVFQLLEAVVPKGRVLDVPCGSGAFTKRIAACGYAVTAADIAAHPAVPADCFRTADMNERLPFDDASFDAIVSIEGIEHIQRPWDFVRECRRVLRDEGYFIITTPNVSSLRSRWRWFLTGFHNKAKYPLDERNPAPRHHINMISYPQLRYMLHTQGFVIERVTTNRIKPANWIYLPAVPLQWASTALAFPAGVRGKQHGAVIDAVRREMLRAPLLFGETMIVAARGLPTP